jgi:hypothetical protein
MWSVLISSVVHYRGSLSWFTIMSSENKTIHSSPGLCAHCRHSRRIESDRGSIFFMCKLSFEDARFAKYPRLPVLACAGYQAEPPNPLTKDA